MKKKWIARIAALCLTAVFCVPAYAEEADTAAEAAVAPVPEATVAVVMEEEPEEISVQTEAPVVVEPSETAVPPEVSEEPEALSEGAEGTEPTETPAAETTPAAEETPVVEKTPAPEATATAAPEVTAEPEATEMPAPTENAGVEESPEASEAPEETASPEHTSSPEASATPEATSTPEAPSELIHGGFVLNINDNDALSLIGWTGEDETVSIPDEVEGKPVASIAASAFAGNEKVRAIAVPAGVISIESGAFSGCSVLEEISVPDSIESVGDLFDGCSALETVRLNISNEIAMTGARSYTREIVEIIDDVEKKRTVSVSFDRDFTDFCVLEGGHWRVEGAVSIAEEHEASVRSGGSLTVAESGSISVLGKMTCEGAAAGAERIFACAGEVSGIENVIRDHSWLDSECSVCGELQTILLDVEILRSSFDKTYDGTSGVDISADDFALSGILEGDEVFIAAINSDFNKKDAGSYLSNIGFVLDGADAGRYAVKQVEIPVVIHQKRVTVTPRSGQGKVYGEKDPTLSAGYKGTVKGEMLQGALSREKGEAAGKYAILSGSLDRMNPNYEIVLSEAYFEIARKSISDSSVSVDKVSNQRYTGEEIEPSVEIRDGSSILAEGADYVLNYSDNASVGTAKIEIVGTGNYSGSRTVTFQIIRVSSGSSDSSLPAATEGGASLDELNDFGSAGTLIDEDAPVAVDTLTIGESDFGYLLFDAADAPLSFIQSERMLQDADNLYSILTVTAQELLNDFDIPLEGDFGQVRMRLSLDAVHAMQAIGYTHIELIVGEAEMRLPLDTLYAEFVSTDGTLRVDYYEVQLWPMKDEEIGEAQQIALADWTLAMRPVHFELMAVPKTEGDEIAVPADVLSLLDGAQLLFAPDIVPDYENTPYSVLRVDLEEMEAQPESAGAMFILDGERVKSNFYPVSGGMYALAAK